MIAPLTGSLRLREAGRIVVKTGGVGYEFENVLYQEMQASVERIREGTRRAAQEIERIVASKTS